MKEGLAPILANEAYPLPVFQVRSGLGKVAMRNARKNGLPVLRFAGRAFVYGRDFHEFLSKQTGGNDEAVTA